MVYEAEFTADNGNTLQVQWSDSEQCWDYTFYDDEGEEIDGGQLGGEDDYETGAVKFAEEVIIPYHDEIQFENWDVEVVE